MDKRKQSNLSRLMSFAGKHRYLTYASWVLSALGAALALLPFVYIWLIIKEVLTVSPDYARAAGIVHNGIMAVVFAAGAILIYIAGLICSHFSAFRVASNIRKALIKRITELPAGVSAELGSGRMRRIVNDSSTASETYLAHQLPDMAGAIVTPIGMIVILFIFDWRFGLTSLIPVILAFAAMMKMVGPKMANDMKAYQDALEDMNNEAVEYVRGIPVVKTFGQTVFSFTRFKDSIDRYYHFCISYTKNCRIPMMFFTVFVNSCFAFLIAAALILMRGGVKEDILLNFIFYTIFTPIVATTMNKIMFMGENGMLVSDALKRIDSILTMESLPKAASPVTPANSSVELRGVSFRYSGAERDALHNVSIKADPGETIALVGPSGGGKSTAAALIARFWDVTEGSVRIGGADVRDIDSKLLSQLVSYVFQDSRLLKTTVLENVRLARPEASRDEVLDALHKAQCDEIIAALPNGIDTVIGTDGIYLSGGEQQRIAIARVILKNSPIVIMDEATAFADPENEVLVQKAFEELAKNKTVIMIAHRLTTVRNADRIYVLNGGSIAESGTHDELIDKNGLYSKMWNEYQCSVNWKVGERND